MKFAAAQTFSLRKFFWLILCAMTVVFVMVASASIVGQLTIARTVDELSGRLGDHRGVGGAAVGRPGSTPRVAGTTVPFDR